MSASMPPPPQGSSTGLYVGVAVLLLAGIGFFAWKSCAPPPPVTVPVTVPTTPPTSTLKIEDIPLPPPIDAGQPDTGPTTVKYVTGPNPCDVKDCKGTASDDLASGLQQRARQAHSCYDRALENDNTLQGRVTLKIKVGSNGAVCGASVVSDELGNAAVANCLASRFRGVSVAAPKGGCVEVSLPINLKPGGR